MRSENAEGVFLDSLAFHLGIDHFISSFQGSSLFLARVGSFVAASQVSLYKYRIRTDGGSHT